MICHRCALRLQAARPSRLLSIPVRYSSTATAASPASCGSHEAPAASTSAAQSSSTSPPRVQSSVAGGTPLKGLGYFKGRDPPTALEDSEYPEWLWGLLDEGKKSGGSGVGGGGGTVEGDEYAKSKKQRQLANRAARKAAKLNPGSLLPKIPLEQQTIDLPGGDGSKAGALEAVKARTELTAAMRKSRRHGIKEDNFLKGMR